MTIGLPPPEADRVAHVTRPLSSQTLPPRSRPHAGRGAFDVTGRPLQLLDLFSGIGGFSLGLERSGGFKAVAFCEIEPFCRRVLAKHWPEVPCYNDIRLLTAERLAADGITVDAICGGFPCQDVSVAGRRIGIGGERSGLWFEYARLIGELRPRFVIVENTPGLLDRGMGDVLGSLASLRYDAEWQSISAARVGLRQPRDRVWIIAYRDGERLQGRFTERAILGIEALPPATVRNALPAAFVTHGSDGLPRQVVRTAHASKALGNAVVPQIPELIGRAILGAIARAA